MFHYNYEEQSDVKIWKSIVGDLMFANTSLSNRLEIEEADNSMLINENDRLTETVAKLNENIEMLERDLKKALELADLSKQGAETPHPFKTN